MKLTSRCEYALLALVYLSRNQPEGYISVETIALAQGIPPKFLDRILLALNRARYVRSSKGQRGGGITWPSRRTRLAWPKSFVCWRERLLRRNPSACAFTNRHRLRRRRILYECSRSSATTSPRIWNRQRWPMYREPLFLAKLYDKSHGKRTIKCFNLSRFWVPT
jgi:hypothetical protein